MNIKSLLLGSAAAMVTVSGAQAADAVVVEAEPVEYVRVCDAYGSGFFFIPGTETCIRFSGYVRTQYTKLSVDNETRATTAVDILDDDDNIDVAAGSPIGDGDNEQWTTRSRFDIDTRNETDWGTLRSLIRLQSNNATDDGDDSNFEVDQAFISIAGLRAGIGGSLFNANFAAGMNLEGVPQLSEDGSYGFTNGHVLDYTYAVDGWTFSVGIEDANGADTSDATGLAKIQYSGDFGTVGIVGEFNSNDVEDAYKAYATLDLSEFVPGGILGGFYMWQDDVTATLNTGVAGRLDGSINTTNGNSRLGVADNIWGVGFQMNLTDNLEFIAYHNHADNASVGLLNDDDELTTIGLNWYPVSGLKVFTAYSFGEIESGGALGAVSIPGSAEGDDLEFDSFLIGLRRSF